MSVDRRRANLDAVDQELDRAKAAYAKMHSAHEAYAVILEELQEFWDEVVLKVPDRGRMRNELVQVAAMAVRALEDLYL